MQTFELHPDPEVAGRIVDDEFPTATPEVRATIVEYAQGVWGCARLLAQACKDRCFTAYNVAEVVGWSLPSLAAGPKEEGDALPLGMQEEDIPTLPVRVVVERQESGGQLYQRLKTHYDAYEQVAFQQQQSGETSD